MTIATRSLTRRRIKIDEYNQKAKIRVGQEVAALMSNQANLDYEGRSYDGIMLNTYRALNYLAMGDTERARPESSAPINASRTPWTTTNGALKNRRRKPRKNKDKKTTGDKAAKDPKFQSALQN